MGEKRNYVVEESQNVYSLIFIGQLVTVLAVVARYGPFHSLKKKDPELG